MLRMVMTVAYVFCVAGQAAAQGDPVTIQKAVREAGAKWTEAYIKGDAKALASLYSEDAYLLPPDEDMIHGRTAIEAFWQHDTNVSDYRRNTIEIKPHGEKTAREVGTSSFRSSDQQLHHNDGRWQLSQDIWNATK